jgi:hypothetical protein
MVWVVLVKTDLSNWCSRRLSDVYGRRMLAICHQILPDLARHAIYREPGGDAAGRGTDVMKSSRKEQLGFA